MNASSTIIEPSLHDPELRMSEKNPLLITESIKAESRRALGQKIKAMRSQGRRNNGEPVTGVQLSESLYLDTRCQTRLSNYEVGVRLPSIRDLEDLCGYLGYELYEALPDCPNHRRVLLTLWGVSARFFNRGCGANVFPE